MGIIKFCDITEKNEKSSPLEMAKAAEILRFNLYSSDEEFECYHKDIIEEYQFFNILDRLNTLENPLMTKEFIEKHIYILEKGTTSSDELVITKEQQKFLKNRCKKVSTF